MKLLNWLKKGLARKSKFLQRQDEIRSGEVSAAETFKPATVSPIPLSYGRMWVDPAASKYDQVFTWEGEPLTDTQYGYKPAPDLWQARAGIPSVIDGMKVFEKHTIVEWNDMTEDERRERIDEWKKVASLGRMGIVMPGDPTPEEKHMARMEHRAKADMEAHKHKLLKELEEAAAEQEQHYQAVPNFGAF
ncbi:hypothetical protein GFL39_26015 [Rhizobium leguminosarum bv. viciae]|uniref:hypothetical protein n=1 Tax=Rhizobium leguminosarum TaxID=384 RepID=UPI00144241F6|nr:hypothetical protein [Rhizobium leguminosarum]NKL08329.1 hypothetical protein [Rhizobium leguminosarum bv. viciae]